MKPISICKEFLFAIFLYLPLLSFAQGNTIGNPIIMGTYGGGSFTYNDSRTNIGYGNEYTMAGDPYFGQSSEDIYYRFTINGPAEVSISTCASNFDTYIHLLKNDGAPLEHNDDNGPLCVGSRASIKTALTAGTYYLVTEGYGSSSGDIGLSVSFVVKASSSQASSDTLNYTRVWEAMSPEQDAGVLLQRPLREVRRSTTYFDGLGRPVQTVMRQGSLATAGGAASDLVSPVVYDEYGREKDKYLPYADVATDGLFKDSALGWQNRFYLSGSSPVAGQAERFFFSRTEQEPSPLGRVTRTLAPGNSWVGAGRGVSVSYQINTSSDSVRLWTVKDVPGGLGLVRSGTVYAAGTLYKKVTTDEAGKKVVEFQDKQGKVLLKKVQQQDLPTEGHSGWLCTYYLYDDLERLRAVLQPAAVETMLLAGSWTPDDPMLSELSFRYEYDARGRMVIKKVPGAGAVYMVYDTRDRLVMTQDANDRKSGASQWLVTVYDDLNRPVETGLWRDDQTLAYHLARAADSTHYPDITSGFELLTRTHYDDYDQLPEGLHSSLTGNYASALNAAGGAPEYGQAMTLSTRTKGLVTWTTTRVLGQQQYLSSVTLYDDKARAIQTQSQHYGGATDISSFQYDFSGKVLRSYLEHHYKQNAASRNLNLATRNTYDDLGRIVKIDKNLDNTAWKSTALFEYDALGSVKHKTLGPDYNNGQGLEALSYDYNIRGWLLGINRDYLTSRNSSGYQSRFFGFELGYDQPATRAGAAFYNLQYNGNIAGMLWKSAGDAVRRKYDFAYDVANRFGRADFTQNTDAASDGPYNTSGANFSVHGLKEDTHSLMQYDANGNILSMVQHGIKGTASDEVIDALHYTYFPFSNKLQQVGDDANDKSSVLGDFHYDPTTKTEVDYGYDENGNLVTDRNKHLDGATGMGLEQGGAIVYNHLNLPSLITVAGKGTIEYVYDAAGNKLAKRVHETGHPDKTTLYLPGGIVYENDSLQFLAHEEGRIRPAANAYAFDYFLKDHLGNVRMVLTDEQSQDAYPVASLEPATLDSEKIFYRIPEAATVNRASVPGYPSGDDYTTPNDYVQRLNGNGQKVGTSMVLKVMSGDRVNIRVSSWYRRNGATGSGSASAAADIVAALVQGISGIPGGKTAMVTPGQQQLLSSGVTSFLRQQSGEPGVPVSKPKAYLNWLLLDEQLHPVITGDGNNSGSEPVGEDQEFTIHQVTERPLTKNGYLYIYLSNESTDVDVFFDNLQVTHVRGAVLEETHYYPFGLTMAGISSEALKSSYTENKKGFNGNELQNKEFSDGSGLEMYDFNARTYDQQIGRFIQIDPLSEQGNQESLTPFQFGKNNPNNFNDPDGKCPLCIIPILIGLLLTSDAAVAPTGKASDAPLIQQAHRDYTISAAMSLVPGPQEVKVSAVLFGAAKQAVKTQVTKAAASLIKEDLRDATIKETSNAARKEVMREAGISTSQQPVSQSKNESGREYTYETTEDGRKVTKTVQQQTKDVSHSTPHWEAGDVKRNPATGEIRFNDYGRPKIDQTKVKVYYSPPIKKMKSNNDKNIKKKLTGAKSLNNIY